MVFGTTLLGILTGLLCTFCSYVALTCIDQLLGLHPFIKYARERKSCVMLPCSSVNVMRSYVVKRVVEMYLFGDVGKDV